MKTRAAVMRGAGKDWEVTELDVDPPKAGEVTMRFVAAGLCHSDDHVRTGDLPPRYPVVGGHEGAGIVEQVGEGVTRLKPGDHVICSFLPVCGHCRFCATGKTNLCDLGAYTMVGCMPDETFRFHDGSEDVGGMCMLGTFSQYATVSQHSCVKVDDDVPLETAVLIGCGVPTGWGTAVHAGGIEPGDTAVIYGIGGIGINAVQGAAYAGAANVVVVDPLEFKRSNALKLGATHAFGDPVEAQQAIIEMTRGVGADQALVTVGVVDEAVISDAFAAIRKGGVVVVTGLGNLEAKSVHVSAGELTLFEKRIHGSLFGSGNPFHDIPRMVSLYKQGVLKLDEIITRRYTLDQINEGYRDLLEGKNIRGVIQF